jgi:GNAT superfamily N-acetyltransferase
MGSPIAPGALQPMTEIDYRISPPLGDIILNRLFASAWPDHQEREFQGVLARSLTYVAAFEENELVGFVHVAWDGGVHAFLLDPTVTPSHRHHGIGEELVRQAAAEIAVLSGVQWLHADYPPEMEPFYQRCGFSPTSAGVLRIAPPE